MAAQLNAAVGETLYLDPKPTNNDQGGKEDETSRTKHHQPTDPYALDSSSTP